MEIFNDASPEQAESFSRVDAANEMATKDLGKCCDCRAKLEECARSLRRYRSVNRKIVLTDKLVRYAKKAKCEIDESRLECARLRGENEALHVQVKCLFDRIRPLEEEVDSGRRKAQEAEAICEHMKSGVIRSLQSQLAELRRKLEGCEAEIASAKQKEVSLLAQLNKESELRSKAENDCIRWQDRFEGCQDEEEGSTGTQSGQKRHQDGSFVEWVEHSSQKECGERGYNDVIRIASSADDVTEILSSADDGTRITPSHDDVTESASSHADIIGIVLSDDDVIGNVSSDDDDCDDVFKDDEKPSKSESTSCRDIMNEVFGNSQLRMPFNEWD